MFIEIRLQVLSYPAHEHTPYSTHQTGMLAKNIIPYNEYVWHYNCAEINIIFQFLFYVFYYDLFIAYSQLTGF